MKIVFMGTPPLAVAALNRMILEGFDIRAVYTKPPKPKGRGYHIEQSPVHTYALGHNIPIETPRTLRSDDALETLRQYQPDIIVVAAYGLILPPSVLTLPTKGCINIHVSLLPRWRGAAPIERAIMAGDIKTGVTIMQMDEGLDTGDILLQKELSIGPDEDISSLMTRIETLGADMITKVLRHDYPHTIQPQEGVTYAHKIESEDYLLSSSDSKETNYNKLRALKACKFFYTPDDFLIIHKAHPSEQIASAPVFVDQKRLFIQCSNGSLEVSKIQRPSKKIITAKEFIGSWR